MPSSEVLDLAFSRIQFTPDLMPADITGTTLIQEDEGGRRFHFEPGPVFANLVLADEVNRATPKVQSALLEAMQERTVTTGGATRPLPEPIFCAGHPKPDRARGDLPVAGGAARPVPVQAVRPLPERRRAGRDRPAHDGGRPTQPSPEWSTGPRCWPCRPW